MANAFGNFLMDKGFNPAAGSTYPIVKYRFVAWAGTTSIDAIGDMPECQTVLTNADNIAGVAQETINATDLPRGKTMPVRGQGISVMEANAASTINPGDSITTDSVGRAIKVGASGAGSTRYGTAVTGTSTTGNQIAVKLGGSSLL